MTSELRQLSKNERLSGLQVLINRARGDLARAAATAGALAADGIDPARLLQLRQALDEAYWAAIRAPDAVERKRDDVMAGQQPDAEEPPK